MGPHPFPWMVREFQRVVGDEAREQCRAILGGADPDVVVACVGGGSNAIGHLRRLRRHRRPARRRRGRRPGSSRAARRVGPRRARRRARHALAVLSRTRTARSSRRTSISAGLDYPGVGPEHAHLAAIGRAEYDAADRRRGARRLPAAVARPRASSPRSSRRTRIGWLVARGRPRGPGGLDRARHPVGPRRQGRRPRSREMPAASARR